MFSWRLNVLQTLLFLINGHHGLSRKDPLVETELGLIRGLRATDGDYDMFMGIPYGRVNESNPFGESTPYGKFDEVFDASNDSAICPQLEQFTNTFFGTLDCLHLNIYVPSSATSKNPLPVLIFIHGGAFKTGFSGRPKYGPQFLVKHDVILVTLNYRLSVYGFMCLDTPEVPGNQGLKDQYMALKWIKRHIHSFGGDSNKITLSGQSAGAISVDFHLLFDKDILFNKAIIQSGTALSPIYVKHVKKAPILIADHLGYSTTGLNNAIDFLAKTEPNLVLAATHDLNIENNMNPCIEKQFKGVEGFITENWITADVPNAKNVPVLIGFNEFERLYAHSKGDDDYFRNINIVENRLYLAFDVENDAFKGMKDIVQRFYFEDDDFTVKSKFNVVNFESDIFFNHPAYRSINRLLAQNAGDIYMYMFSYVGERNCIRKRENITDPGAVHGDELSYLFGVSYMNDINDDDKRMLDVMTTMWTNFVKYGNPTSETSEPIPIKWTPITDTKSTPFLKLDKVLSMGSRPHGSRMTFWDLFYKTNEDLQRPYPEYTDVN